MIKNRKLSRALADSGWRSFINALTYKCDWVGKNILTVNRFAPSSKTCHRCGAKQETMPLNVREWQCNDCGSLHDRDINAAINIKAFALADAVECRILVLLVPHIRSVNVYGIIRKRLILYNSDLFSSSGFRKQFRS